MAQRKRSEINFEESLQKLEAIVKRLEEEEIPLETSLKLFAEGQTLARACEQQLKAAENQIRQLLEKNSGEIDETEFTETAASEEDAPAEGEAEDGSPEADPPPAAARHKKNEPGKSAAHTPDDLPF